MRTLSIATMSALAMVMLSGCDNEKARVQLHEPGKYLGKATVVKVDEDAIKKRFSAVQTDR